MENPPALQALENVLTGLQVIFVVVLVAAFVWIFYAYWKADAAAAALKELAKERGLRNESEGTLSSPVLVGTIRDIPVRIATVSIRLPSTVFHRHPSELRTTISAELPRVWHDGFKIRKRNSVDEAGEDVRSTDGGVGDAEFDTVFRVQGSLPQPVRQMLSQSDVQRALLRCADNWPHFSVEKGKLYAQAAHAFQSVDEFRELIEVLVDAAATLGTAEVTGGQQDEGIEESAELFPDPSDAADTVSEGTDESSYSGTSW